MSFAVRTILFSAVPFVFIAHAAHSFEAKGQLQRFGVRLTEKNQFYYELEDTEG